MENIVLRPKSVKKSSEYTVNSIKKTSKLPIFLNIFVAIICFLTTTNLQSAKLKVVRTDVDSTRDTIITASYNFSFDLYADELENCNSAAFQIRFNNASDIKLSSYKIGDFGENGKVLLVPPQDVNPSGESILKIGVTSGLPIGENNFDNPKLLSIEFTVLQSAVHKEKMKIEFLDATATAFIDGEPKEVKLKADSVVYRIHSFVNVYPGDANNDGIVDIKDWTKIDLFTSIAPVSDKSRRFKRKNASTMWTNQLVLAWDNELATYADCDGDGAITVSDAIVVVQNDSKTHGIFAKKDEVTNDDNSKDTPKKKQEIIQNSEFNLTTPLNFILQEEKKYRALEVYLNLYKVKNKFKNEQDYNSFIQQVSDISFEPSGQFAKDRDKSQVIIDKRELDKGIISLAIASFSNTFESIFKDNIGTLLLSQNAQENTINIQNLNINFNDLIDNIYGVDLFGNKFKILASQLTDITAKNNDDFTLEQHGNSVYISSSTNNSITSVKIFALSGEEIICKNCKNQTNQFNYSNSEVQFNLEDYNLPIGVYLVQVEAIEVNNTDFTTIPKVYVKKVMCY